MEFGFKLWSSEGLNLGRGLGQGLENKWRPGLLSTFVSRYGSRRHDNDLGMVRKPN